MAAFEKEMEKERAIMENAIKRIDDLKKAKNDSEKFSIRCKKEIDDLKNKQLDLEKKVTDLIGKMTAYEERLGVCRKHEG